MTREQLGASVIVLFIAGMILMSIGVFGQTNPKAHVSPDAAPRVEREVVSTQAKSNPKSRSVAQRASPRTPVAAPQIPFPVRHANPGADSFVLPGAEVGRGDQAPPSPEDGADEAWFDAHSAELSAWTRSCEAFWEAGHAPILLTAEIRQVPGDTAEVLNVRVHASPSLEDALTECLSEGMHTLSFDDLPVGFHKQYEFTSGTLDELLTRGYLSEEEAAEIRAQMRGGGLDPDEDPMVMSGLADPPGHG